jgi:L-lactate utilization protein LutC
MTTAKERFLQRVRQALRTGSRAGQAVPLPARNRIAYQGAGADPVSRFREEFAAAGGFTHMVANRQDAVRQVMELARAKAARRVLLGHGLVLDSLNLLSELRKIPVEVASVGELSTENSRDSLFAADLGISGAHCLVAETGSLVVMADPGEPRSLSLLPPVHIAIAHKSQIIPDLFDLFDQYQQLQSRLLSSCLTIITGPSKTGDIELRLVTGVHGPGEVHVVLILEDT